MDGRQPYQRSPPRRYRDYDRPAEPKGYEDDSRAYREGGDFRIKGQASRNRSSSPQHSSRHEDPHGYRQRDTRYDSTSYGYANDRARCWTDRDTYDATVHAQHRVQESAPVYRGDGDVGSTSTPLKFLLLRGLKQSTSPIVLAKGLEKLYRNDESSTGAGPGSLRSVMLMCDRRDGNAKRLSFGFAWYHSVEDAKSALARAGQLGDDFTISSQTISVDMPHMGVFPRTDFTNRSTNSRFTFVVPDTGHEHEYRNEQYYPVETVVNKSAPQTATGSETSGRDEDVAADAATTSRKRMLGTDQTTIAPKRVQMNSAMSALTNRWSAQHAKIHEGPENPAGNGPASNQPAIGINALVPQKSEILAVSNIQTFAYDSSEKKCCYLCNRYLADSIVLKAHVEASQLHAANLKDEARVKEAYQRMEKAGISPDATITWETAATSARPNTTSPDPVEQTSQYVDRAALRRQEEKHQAPGLDKPKGFSLKNIKDTTHRDNSSTPPPSKGLGMLQKHGYQAGQGLGAEGSTGMTTPIATDLYAAGVGLGHTSGKLGDAVEEAERATKGDRAGYLEKIKDNSRARYEAMNNGDLKKQ